ncbi:hypothetical protein [Streptomyces hiroshimensis]|uniref:Uncharacterized protein n=1 Tax=Streptomyces hiroshimensis TaxID=66424 RepID=A0ABQ2YWW7_9ACTN|nr:hypothetical protein [Streptomyces hiroshimensis]GGX98077.1 hypothetical protein GCM10010324_50540 [Streptomyces hiroshimensis]
MRLIRPALVALAGCALALALPAGAAVATKGWFSWTGPKGAPFYIENPPDGRCLTMSDEARGAHNGTPVPVALYTDKTCKKKALGVSPGGNSPRNLRFASVRFGSH